MREFPSRRVIPSLNVPLLINTLLILDRETVQQESSIVALAKSPNKHNRIYMTAQPLNEELVTDIESEQFDIVKFRVPRTFVSRQLRLGRQ